MATVLLFFIYFIYIGLGIPDSAIGSAWPSIYPDLNLPIGYASFIMVIISLCTASSSFFSAKLINKFGTGLVTAVSTLVTAFALLGFSISTSIWWLCISSVPAGFGAGAIDAALNDYVAIRYKSSSVSFLHCFYGIGVALTPFLMSFALKNNDWRLGYRLIFYIQIGIAIISFAVLPLWKKVKAQNPSQDDYTPIVLSYPKMAKIPEVRLGWLVFFTTCGLEFSCNTWATSFFVNTEKATEAVASLFLTFYYLGITVGRFISGLLAKKLTNKSIVLLGYILVAIAIILLILPVGATMKGVALCMIGLGNGPSFPNLIYLTPKCFGKECSRSIIASQMAMCNIGILVIPMLFGLIANNISVSLFPYFLLLLYMIIVPSMLVYFRQLKHLNERGGLTFNNNNTEVNNG